MHINQSGRAVTGEQRVVYRGPHQCRICNMSAFHQEVFGMTTTAVLVEFFSTEWIEINDVK